MKKTILYSHIRMNGYIFLNQSHSLIQSQGNVHVLYGRTTCSLAQVIKSRTQDNLLSLIIREDKQLQFVGILELIRRQKGIPLQQTRFLGTGFAQGHDFDEDGSLVVLCQDLVHLGTSCSRLQPRIVKGDRDDHALVKVANSRLENGLGSQARVLYCQISNESSRVLADCKKNCIRLDNFNTMYIPWPFPERACEQDSVRKCPMVRGLPSRKESSRPCRLHYIPKWH
jgi:hypothetical protein